MRYRLDRRVELRDHGRVALGGDPTRLLRLSDVAAKAITGWRSEGVEGDGVSVAMSSLIERLVDAAMFHPVPGPSDLEVPAVVVPVRDRPEALDRCLDALVASGVTDIVVVDDGSVDPDAHAIVARRHAAEVVRRPTAGGPSAARMDGWRHLRDAEDPPALVAFVDSDVVATLEFPGALLGHFDTPEVGLVAPRVAHVAGDALIDRYEVANSPLDLGPDPAPVVAGTRVAYVPAAAIVVRTRAFAEVGGFDIDLEVGEDVDLLWRLADAGWRCRYEPASVVHHEGRDRWGRLLRRRFDYGRSAALLDVRHRGSLPPVRGSGWSAAVVGAALAGHPVPAGGLVAWTIEKTTRRLGGVPEARSLAARLVLRGHLGFARQVARAVVRPWLPITLLVAICSRRVRRVAVVAAIVGPLVSWWEERPQVALPAWVAIWLADDIAYTAGVWFGCRRARSWGAIRPQIALAKTQK